MRILELRQKRARLADEAGKLLPTDGGKMTPEVRLKFEKIMHEVDALQEDIRTAERDSDPSERHAELDRELRESSRPQEAGLDGFDEARNSTEQRKYRKAFNSFLRHGMVPSARGGRGVSEEDRAILLAGQERERRDMGVLGAGAAGEYFVPQGFQYEVEEAMKWYDPCSKVRLSWTRRRGNLSPGRATTTRPSSESRSPKIRKSPPRTSRSDHSPSMRGSTPRN